MLHIGCHLSSSKGFAAMGRQALELGADTFQFFTRNPRGSRAKDLDADDAAALVTLLGERGFAPIVAHAPYTLNLCGAKEENRAFAQETMADDLVRLEHVPGQEPAAVDYGIEQGKSHGLRVIVPGDAGKEFCHRVQILAHQEQRDEKQDQNAHCFPQPQPPALEKKRHKSGTCQSESCQRQQNEPRIHVQLTADGDRQ